MSELETALHTLKMPVDVSDKPVVGKLSYAFLIVTLVCAGLGVVVVFAHA